MKPIKPSPVRALLFCAALSVCCLGAGAALSQDSGQAVSRGIHILEPPTSAAPENGNSAGTPAPSPPANEGTGLPAPPPAPQPSAANPSSSPAAAESGSVPLLVPAPPKPAASEQQGSDTGAAPPSAPPAAGEAPTQPATALNPDNGIVPPAADNPAGGGNVAPAASTADLAGHANGLDPSALSGAIQVPDAAGLAVQISPGPEIAAGSPVSFEITTKKSGYLILVDVNAAGKAVQIYPNPMSLIQPKDVREKVNFIRPGKVVRLPDGANPYSGFELVASPPRGTAMVVALLSERPVQLLDLPDLPDPAIAGVATVDDFVKFADALRIPNRDGDGSMEDAHWSFAVTPYAVR